MAAELELLELVAEPVCASSCVRFEETANQAKKIHKQVMKQEVKHEAKQAAWAASTPKATGKRTSASSQLSRLMESPFPLLALDENPRHDTTWPLATGTPKSKASQSKAAPQPSRLPVPPSLLLFQRPQLQVERFSESLTE